MSENAAGAGWTAELAITPKKHKAFEDKLGSETPVRFSHRINQVSRKAPPQTREIADSDSDSLDDNDDDDVELPSLDVMFGVKSGKTTRPFSLRSGQSSVEATPEKKLADFMAVIKDTEDANELDRMEAAMADGRNSSPLGDGPGRLEGRALFEEAVNLVQDEDDGGDSDKDQHYARVRQAMDRQAAEHTAPSYYFFVPVTEASSSPGTPARGSPSPGPMPGPNHPHMFDLAIRSRLASKFQVKPGIVLPDELLIWILETFSTERSEARRAECLQILTDHNLQVGNLIDEERLRRLFISIGAQKHAISYGQQGRTVALRDASKTSRDWTPFCNIMMLLRHCCGWMAVDALVHASVFLLRASMDSEVRLQANIATVVNDTIATLTANCPDQEREKFCRKVCNLFVQTVDSVNLLSRAVEATHHIGPQPSNPINPPAATFQPFRDLRTRLQLSVFFKDAEKATPERCGTAQLLLASILQRLDDPDFKGSSRGAGARGRGAINYYDLDGYGLALTDILPFLHYLRQQTTTAGSVGAAEAAAFRAGIDDLRRKVSFVTSTIQIVGSMEELEARHEAKNRWERVGHWISHFFPKKGGVGIFDDEEMTDEKAEAQARALGRQARLMERWARKEPVGGA